MLITPSPKTYHFNTSHHQSIFVRRFFIYSVLIILLGIIIFFWLEQLNHIKTASAQEITQTQEQFYLNQKNVLEKTDKNAFELFAIGKKLLDKNSLEMAKVYFEVANQKDQNYRDGTFYLAYSYLKLAETPPDYLDKKMIKQFSNQNMDKSLESFLKAKDLDPLYGPTYEFLSYIYNKKGDAENAKLCYNKFKQFAS